MSSNRKFDEAQSEEILKCISNTLVGARIIQHICWEIQPDMIKLCKMLERPEKTLLDSEQTVYNNARKMADSLSAIYNSLPDYIKRTDVKSFYLTEVYDAISCLEGVDDVLSEVAKEVEQTIKNE